MSRNFEEVTEQFDVESEDGRRFTMAVYTGMMEFQPMGSGSPKCLPTGMKRFCTTSGHACNRIDDDTYEITALGLRVKRINTD